MGPEHRDVKGSPLPDMRVRYMHIGGHSWLSVCLVVCKPLPSFGSPEVFFLCAFVVLYQR